jgi:hypothetical protein
MCGATNYRRVVARDDLGALRATELYQCSGCSVVFADPKAWRDGDTAQAPSPTTSSAVQYPATGTSVPGSDSAPRAPNLATYGIGPTIEGPAE